MVTGGFVEDLGIEGVAAMYAEACAEGESERWRSALLFSQLRRVAASAAGSENLADGVAARRLLIVRLNSPLLGMPVSIKKQWISLTETRSGLAGLPKSVLNCWMLVDSVWRNRLRVESPCWDWRRLRVRSSLVDALPVEWIRVSIAQNSKDF